MKIQKIILTIALLLGVVCISNAQTKSTAVYDTIQVSWTKDIKGLTRVDEKGKCYAIYCNGSYQELVNCSKTVREYILLCEENKITPQLALKLRNGKISSLIKYQAKFTRR